MEKPHLTRRSFVGLGVGALAAGTGVALGVTRCSAGDAEVPSEPKGSDAAAGSGSGAAVDAKVGGKLVMYTCCDEALINAFVPGFMQETGVVVDVVRKSAAECRDDVAAEVAAGRVIADVVWGGDEDWYAAGEACFEKYFSSGNTGVLDECRNADGFVTPITREVCAIAVNSAKAAELVAVADPQADAAGRSSREAVHEVGNLLPAFVTTAEDGSVVPGGDAFLAAMDAQTGGNMRATSEDVLEDVLSGEAVAGLVYEQAAAAIADLTGEVEVVLPREGCLVVHGCTAIARGATNLAQARAWVDFACGENAQRAAAGKVRLRSVRDGIGEKDDFAKLVDEE